MLEIEQPGHQPWLCRGPPLSGREEPRPFPIKHLPVDQRRHARGVGVIARVPLASGLLTSKMSAQTAFAADDHRAFNRNGEAFDKGETFAGVPYDVALDAVEEIRALLQPGQSMAEFALRWILMDAGVTTVIPGAKTAAQARANAGASDQQAIPDATMQAIRAIYDERIAPHVHQLW